MPGVDHGPHAPSIAISRMAVTCGLPVNGAMASAINVLDDVHGGAGQQCMELLPRDRRRRPAPTAISSRGGDGRSSSASAKAGDKIVPGFGHRFHPVDPRTRAAVRAGRKAEAAATVTGRWARSATRSRRR